MALSSEHGLWAPVVEGGGRKDRSAFGRLPREVRDEIIAGFDNGSLTLDAARELLLERGYDISRTALGAAYAKLRRARRSLENRETLVRLLREFQAQPSERVFDALAKLLAAQVSEALTNDAEADPQTIKAAARALDSMAQLARLAVERMKLERAQAQGRQDEKPSKSVAEVAREVYGVEL